MARRATFTEDGARRIAAATRAYERGNRDQSPIKFRTAWEEGEPVRLGKTVAAWDKGTLQTIDLYETGTPLAETASGTLEDCVNKFANVGSGKWVIVSRATNGSWYLISAEC